MPRGCRSALCSRSLHSVAVASVLTAGALAGGIAAWPALAAGLPEPRRGDAVEITADEIIYDARTQVYIAKGSVRVEQRDRLIEAEWVVFNRETQRGIASGSVLLVDGDERLEARFVEFDYATQQGLVFRGRLDMGPGEFIMGAEKFVKTGKHTYTAHDVSFTTCRCDDPEDRLPWRVNAEDADVEVGGYARTTNTSVDILGVPTIWLPWAFFPVKTDRESGFLFPEFGYQSQNGFEVGVPFFWAARHNINVTVVPRYFTTRGFKPEVEVEAVYGEKSETSLVGTFIDDRDPRNSRREFESDKRRISGAKRWALGFDNDAYLPFGWRARSDITIVSDNDFVRDFSDYDQYRRERFLESNAFAFNHFTRDGSATIVGGLTYADDRQNPDYEDRDKFVLQRAPSISADLLPSVVPGAWGFAFELDTDYTQFRPFERAENALSLGPGDNIVGDDQFVDTGVSALPLADLLDQLSRAQTPLTPAEVQEVLALLGQGNGRFDEGEPLDDEGQRFIIYPHISRPFHVGPIDVQPEIGWQQTLYSTRAQSFADRGLLTARVEASTRVLGMLDVPWLGPTAHLLEPRLGWALVQRDGQSGNPLFVPRTAVAQSRLRQLSLDNVILDSADRIDSANMLTLGLANRFYTGKGAARRLAADVQVSWAYDFAGESAGHLKDLILDGRTFAASGLKTHGILSYDMDRGEISEVLADIELPTFEKLPVVDHFDVKFGYRYRRDIPVFYEFFPSVNAFKEFKRNFQHINQISVRTKLEINRNWTVGSGTIYSLETKIVQQNLGFVEYTSSCNCWAARVDVNNSRTRGVQAGFRISLLGFGNDRGSPFDGRAYGTSTAR